MTTTSAHILQELSFGELKWYMRLELPVVGSFSDYKDICPLLTQEALILFVVTWLASQNYSLLIRLF